MRTVLSPCLLASLVVLGAATRAEAAPPSAADGKAIVATIDQLATAVKKKQAAALAKVMLFPVAVRYYDLGESKTVEATLKDGRAALGSGAFYVDPKFVAAARKSPLVKTGQDSCANPDEAVDFAKGAAAIDVSGDAATVAFMSSPCNNLAEKVTFKLRRVGKAWKVVGRDTSR